MACSAEDQLRSERGGVPGTAIDGERANAGECADDGEADGEAAPLFPKEKMERALARLCEVGDRCAWRGVLGEWICEGEPGKESESFDVGLNARARRERRLGVCGTLRTAASAGVS